MKDAYTEVFFNIVKETKVETGYELPEHIEAYVVMLLAHNVERPDFLPKSSFAEAFLKLRNPADHNAKDLGDACLFLTGVFPTYGRKHGLNRRYYQDIGSTSYEMVAEVMNGELFSTLATHFVFVSDFIELTVNSSKLKHSNLFR
jgi:hypothetical protein